MSEEPKKEPQWEQGNLQGPNEKLFNIALGLAKLHRMNIEKKLSDMKAHVNAECAKLNHPLADQFADEINKLKVE